MKPVQPSEFERNCADASGAPDVYGKPMIRTQMNGRDWLILGSLALIWGGAFFFIGVAVRHVQPLTYVLLRLSIAATAMWLFLRLQGQSLGGDVVLSETLALDPAVAPLIADRPRKTRQAQLRGLARPVMFERISSLSSP